MLQLQALEIGEKNGIGNFRATPSWQKLSKPRHKFSMRARTRQGQNSPEESSLVAVQLGDLVRRTAKELGISKIFNADQNACFVLNILPKALAKTEEKTVWVRCSGKEKERATVILLGDSNGGKYPPTVVFKIKRSAFEETAQENLRVRHGFGSKVWKEVRAIEDATGLSIFDNTTAWWNELQQLQFLAQHFAQRHDMSQAVLLLLDDFSGPVIAKVVAYAKEINVVVLKVPPRFTSVCQPADVSWMKPFKDKMRGQWIDFLRLQIRERRQQTTTQQTTTAFKMKSPIRTDTGEWIDAAWRDLSAETIRAGYSREHMRTEKVQPAFSELIAELESFHVVDIKFGDTDSDDDFDR
uniref:Uncharacterized protein AlNc14C46G3748 n=1 Tax=Albugo laibachii Nc14 TaxID=890382 RepID=F0WAN4_9STRA|nr:conserved hypothetical protein [Albugo laibachii Nc14]|eukprot:CCA18205.1 conserved hypothetical protein [Albugo laibachii Nc14]